MDALFFADILMEFTKSLRAFSNLTEPIRRSLCKVMVFAWVETADTVVLKDNELVNLIFFVICAIFSYLS